MSPLDLISTLTGFALWLMSNVFYILVPVVFVLVVIWSVLRYFVWPTLCDFGNWLGRE